MRLQPPPPGVQGGWGPRKDGSGRGAEEASPAAPRLSCWPVAAAAGQRLIILSISAKQQKHGPLSCCSASWQARTSSWRRALTTFTWCSCGARPPPDYDWNESICKVFVSTYARWPWPPALLWPPLPPPHVDGALASQLPPQQRQEAGTARRHGHLDGQLHPLHPALHRLAQQWRAYYARGCQFIVSKIVWALVSASASCCLGALSWGWSV